MSQNETATVPSYSYMITNNQQPDGSKPQYLSNGELSWYLSNTSVNDTNVSDYIKDSAGNATEPSQSYSQNIIDQLNAQKTPNLTVFIHGLSTTWTQAISDTGTFGLNLTKNAYDGLTIGFSWPSFNKYGTVFGYGPSTYNFPVQPSTSSDRGNIGGSLESFQNFMNWIIDQVKVKVPNLILNVVCHSEGNFLLLNALNAFTADGVFDNCLMLAADTNNGIFLESSLVKYSGQGLGITNNFKTVTVYFNSNDDVLAKSEGVYSNSCHNPNFSGRLGLQGPSYNQGSMFNTVYSVDCSAQMTPTIAASEGVDIHTGYLYLIPVLNDIIQVLNCTDASSVAGRTPSPIASGAYFI